MQEALPFFNTAIETNSSIAQFWLSYIDALMKLGRSSDAKAELDQAKSKGAKGDALFPSWWASLRPSATA